jgi:hypothetical protein
VTTAVAIYAAVVSTAALTLELVSEWRSWGTRVEVTVEPGMAVIRPGAPDEPAVVFRLINHSAHRVKITHLGVEPLRRGGKHLFFAQPLPLGVPGPFEIPSRDAITLHQPPAGFKDGDPRHKTRALVTTSDGKRFRSKRVRVQDLMS